MRSLSLSAGAVLGLLGPGACAPIASPTCPPGKQRMVDETLYLGTGLPNGVVSADQWRSFIRTEVEPRFPKGFTVLNGAGQWRNANGDTVRETTYLIRVVHAPDPSSDDALAEIAAAYRKQFSQESILRVSSPVCAAW